MLLKKQNGFSLLELMIALVVSSFIFVGVMGMFASMLKHSSFALQQARLDRDLQTSMQVMVNDIHRTGYWGNALSSNVNPFMDGSTDISITGSCILLAYDQNADGTLPAISYSYDDERYGFRLIDNAIQFRQSGAAFDCAAGDSEWTNLTDKNNVSITQLTFTLNSEPALDIDGTGAGTDTMTVRTVTISITGQLVGDTSVSKTIIQTVKLYNDKYTP